MEDREKLIQSFSPNERKILPFIEEPIEEICLKSGLDLVSVLRSLEYLQNKDILKIHREKKKIVEVGVNGALYRRKGLPERRLLNLIAEKRILSLEDAQKESGLSGDEFKASIGALKKKALIELKNGKLSLFASSEEVSRKSLEELFLESLPLDFDSLSPEQKFSLKSLENRKNIIEYLEEKKITLEVTKLGKSLIKEKLNFGNLIEKIDLELLRKEQNWRGKKFRRYDVSAPLPGIYGGKRHFVNSATDYARRVWTEMGFEEMRGNLIQSSFWNFDALFTAQDHPVRDLQDTFFLGKNLDLPEKSLVNNVKSCHEKGVEGSNGWRYEWNEDEAKKAVLRTHTTCLSAFTLSQLKERDLPKKYFSVGKCFRNETLDWNHGFEFNQTEGIVVDFNTNFRQLLGYLKEFARKMGFEKIRFRPAYFPYTEPSLEGDVWDEERKEWVEYIAAGIFRPEVTKVLFGKVIPILAWGPGFDRMIMKALEIKDIRELYKNDINQLRRIKSWMK